MIAMHALHLLVPTKLTAPQPLTAWVRRAALVDRLQREDAAQLVLVIAPAGFGKSTFVAQWITEQACLPRVTAREGGAAPPPSERAPSPAAWLTLDEHDQDPLRFLAYLVGAILRVAPGSLPTTVDLLAAREPPPLYVIVQTLLVDLDALPAGLTLVLDDYHAVTNRDVHQVVAYLVRHLPPQCRLVLSSRTDPALPLARLRAERNLAEIRAADLRFSELEAETLLCKLTGAPPEHQLVREVHQQTDGWPLALQLAALARADGLATRQALGSAQRQIAEYLTSEVLARQPEPTQQLLLRLAVPQSFCADLCAALIDEPADRVSAEGLLEQIVKANLFLVPLDTEGRWYRFHHLFRDLLLRRLRLQETPEKVQALHRQVAHWLAEERIDEDAVRHFLAAGDADAAADLVEQRLFPEIDKDVSTVPPRYWLNLLPPHLVEQRPALALMLARMALFNLDQSGLELGLARVDALLSPATAAAPPQRLWPRFYADLAAMRGILHFWKAEYAEAIDLLRAALQQGATAALATQAILVLGLAYAGTGSHAAGVQMINTELRQFAERLPQDSDVYLQTCLAWLYQIAGDLAAEAQTARRLADLVAIHHSGDLWFGYALMSQAAVAYERNDLRTAADAFYAVSQRKYRVSYPAYMASVIGLTLIALAHGDAAAATFADEARDFADTVGGAYLRHHALGCAIHVALARGDMAAAIRAADQITADLASGLNIGFEIAQLTRARALIASGDPERLSAAAAILNAYRVDAERLQHIRLLIRTLAIQALLFRAQGRSEAALTTLAHAVALAEPHGFVRTFVDLGSSMQDLLRALAQRGTATAYCERLLSAFNVSAAPEAQQLRPSPPPARFPEMLTRREIEILGFLAKRWSDKEIAAHLVITPNTVRKHTSTIYNKLGVGGRREAVSTARTLGLLPPADYSGEQNA
jgi:LuxR family maltose regulon positive regulatory protein